MATERQIEANRKNAQLSTGPRSVEGKSRVASNALTHGLTGKQVVLQHEDPKEFEAFGSELRDALAPVGAVERLMVEKIVSDAWRIRRVPMLEAALHARAKQETIIDNIKQEIEKQENDPYKLTELAAADAGGEGYKQARATLQAAIRQIEEQPLLSATHAFLRYERELGNLARHEEGLLRSMLKMLHELQRLQAERAGKDIPAPAVLDVNLDVNSELASIPDREPTLPARHDVGKNS